MGVIVCERCGEWWQGEQAGGGGGAATNDDGELVTGHHGTGQPQPSHTELEIPVLLLQ